MIDDEVGVVTSEVRFRVTNTGSVTGAEVAQLYLTFPEAAGEPGKRLVGFDRIELAPGETRDVEIAIESSASNHPFSIWDVNADAWTIVDGTYLMSVGSSSRDLRLSDPIQISGLKAKG